MLRTFQYYTKEIQNFEIKSLLSSLGDKSLYLYERNSKISLWTIEAIAMFSFLGINFNISRMSEKHISTSELNTLMKSYYYVDDAMTLNIETEVFLFFWRMSFEQMPSQKLSLLNELTRNFIVFSNNHTLENAFISTYGITPKKYIYSILMLYSLISIRKSSSFSFIFFVERRSQALKYLVTDDELYLVFNLISKTHFEICAEINNPKIWDNSHGYEKYVSNPFINSPIVTFDKELAQCFVPSVPSLIRKMSSGIYWDLRKVRSVSKFLDFGNPFKEYVGMLLESCTEKPLNNLDSQLKYKSNKLPKRADWIVREQNSDIVIECKIATVKQEIKNVKAKAELENWVRKEFGNSIDQLRETDKVSPCNGRKRQRLVVTHYDYFGINNSWIKDLLHHDANYFDFISIGELEQIQPWIKYYGFTKIIKLRRNLEATKRSPISFFDACIKLDSGIDQENMFLQHYRETYLLSEILDGNLA